MFNISQIKSHHSILKRKSVYSFCLLFDLSLNELIEPLKLIDSIFNLNNCICISFRGKDSEAQHDLFDEYCLEKEICITSTFHANEGFDEIICFLESFESDYIFSLTTPGFN